MTRHKKDRPVSTQARLLGSCTSGLLEICMFHPFDTTVKRLQSNQNRINSGKSYKQLPSSINQIIFKEHADSSFTRRYLSMYEGISAAFGYKILQRMYRFGGQPMAAEYLSEHYFPQAVNMFGENNAKPAIHACTGAIMGVAELAILPLDVWKVKKQTNPGTFKGLSFKTVVKKYGWRRLYQGAPWTVARNSLGSFVLFGGNAFAKEVILDLDDYSDATLTDNFISSFVGSIACILATSPMDVIKTRVQNKNWDAPVKGRIILVDLVKKEGMRAFFKGLGPKLIFTGPKLTFAFTSAQTIIQYLEDKI